AYDPAVASLPGVELLPSVDALLRRADIVSLHAPLIDATRQIINAERLALMKPTALLVNTARGGLVDQPALLQALRRQAIAGTAQHRHARPWAWHPRVDHAEPRRTRRSGPISASQRTIFPQTRGCQGQAP